MENIDYYLNYINDKINNNNFLNEEEFIYNFIEIFKYKLNNLYKNKLINLLNKKINKKTIYNILINHFVNMLIDYYKYKNISIICIFLYLSLFKFINDILSCISNNTIKTLDSIFVEYDVNSFSELYTIDDDELENMYESIINELKSMTINDVSKPKKTVLFLIDFFFNKNKFIFYDNNTPIDTIINDNDLENYIYYNDNDIIIIKNNQYIHFIDDVRIKYIPTHIPKNHVWWFV